VHMITSFNDEGSTEHTSKKARLASPDIDHADQSADNGSDNDIQLTGAAASSSKQGGVTSRGRRQDDKGDLRDSTKTRLKARGPRYGPVLRPEGSSDFYDSHLCCEYEYTGPYKKTSEPTSETRPPPLSSTRRFIARSLPAKIRRWRSLRLPLTAKALLSVLPRSRVLPRQPL
jgi:hypothetical protein